MKESISIVRLVGDAYVFTMMPVVKLNRQHPRLKPGACSSKSRSDSNGSVDCDSVID